MPRLLPALMALSLLAACSSSIRPDEQDAEKPVVIVAAKDAAGARIPAATAPTVPAMRSATPRVPSGQGGASSPPALSAPLPSASTKNSSP